MRMDERSNFFGCRFPVHREVTLTELLCDPRTNHVHTENAAGFAVGRFFRDHFHQPVGLTDDERAPVAENKANPAARAANLGNRRIVIDLRFRDSRFHRATLDRVLRPCVLASTPRRL